MTGRANVTAIALLQSLSYPLLLSLPFLFFLRAFSISIFFSPVIDVYYAYCLSSPDHPSSWMTIVSSGPIPHSSLPLSLTISLAMSLSSPLLLLEPLLHISGGSGDRCGSRANTVPRVIVRSEEIRYFSPVSGRVPCRP